MDEKLKAAIVEAATAATPNREFAKAIEQATGRPFLDFLMELLTVLLPIILEILKNMPAITAERPTEEP